MSGIGIIMRAVLAGAVLLVSALVAAEPIKDPSQMVLCDNIGEFKKTSCTCGLGAGLLKTVDHFNRDHEDYWCEAAYAGPGVRLRGKAQVTYHAGGESDLWLVHELEKGYRVRGNLYETYVSGNPVREIGGYRIFQAGGYFRWVSYSVVVSIDFPQYLDVDPEPAEVIRAYLKMYPSTMPSTLSGGKAQNDLWIKTEMDLRFWHYDKWMELADAGKVSRSAALAEGVYHLKEFLNYRAKYYGASPGDDLKILQNAAAAQDEATIKDKLQWYRAWWGLHKNDPLGVQKE